MLGVVGRGIADRGECSACVVLIGETGRHTWLFRTINHGYCQALKD